MKGKFSLAPVVAIVLSGPLAADDSTTREIDALRTRLEQLEKEVKQNRSEIETNQADIRGDYQKAKILVRDTINDNARAAARIDNAMYGDDLQGFFKLPNTDSILRIGGYVRLNAIYDFDPTGNPSQFIVADLPKSGASDQFHMDANQTRVNFELRRPTDIGPLRILIENDFAGASNRPDYHLRHAYAQIANILGGYSFSTFMDADALPNTLDFAGPGGAVFVFTPQLRYTLKTSQETNIAFAIERPASEIDYHDGPLKTPAESTPWPDFIVRGRWENEVAHLQLGALARRVAYDNGTLDGAVNGYGGSFSGTVKTFGLDSMQFAITGGRALGHYYSDLSGDENDAAFNADNQLRALRSGGGYLAYQHYWSERWNSSLVYGLLKVDNVAKQVADAVHRDEYGALNLIWSPMKHFDVGVELLHGELKRHDGSKDSATRIQFSFQVSLAR